jgi:hypothetical protein
MAQSAAVEVTNVRGDSLVGRRMRAMAGPGGLSRTVLVLCTTADTCEVEYDDDTEGVVPMDSLVHLLPFEYAAVDTPPLDDESQNTPHSTAERFKAQGNHLFKLRDARAALGRYACVLRVLQDDAPFAPGARCLVKPAEDHGHARAALLLTVEADGSAADIEYEGGAGGEKKGGELSARLSELVGQAGELERGELALRDGEGDESAGCEVEEDGVP